jgi:hypothetical protein
VPAACVAKDLRALDPGDVLVDPLLMHDGPFGSLPSRRV